MLKALLPLLAAEENRREFVELYVSFWLNRSIHTQFEAFAKGFLMLCGGPALQLFSATELERLVCGNPFLDFDNLQKSARYEGGYSPGGWAGAAAHLQVVRHVR